MSKEKKVEILADKEMVLKVNLKHPAKKFRLGRHVIGAVQAKYVLNHDEQLELLTAGPKKWLIVVEEKKAAKQAE